MQDFDEVRKQRLEQDRSFQINGETFVRRASIAPEDILDWSQFTTGEKTIDEAGFITLMDDTVLACLESGQEEKWQHARRRDCDLPISVADLEGLMRWLIGEVVGRPTGPSSASSPGDDVTTTTSRDESSSQEAPVSPV